MTEFTTQQEKDLYEDLKELVNEIEPLGKLTFFSREQLDSILTKSKQLKEKYLIPDA